MEINSDYKPAAAETPVAAESAAKANGHAAPRLGEGDVVRGVVTDIQRDQVSILLENGETITAKLAAPISPPGAKIGAEHTFVVRLDENGTPMLELKAPTPEAAQKSTIADTLASFGMKPTEHNMKLALTLLENRLPLTPELMRTMNQAVKLMGGEATPEAAAKALFMIRNGMAVNTRAAQTLSGLAEGQVKLAGQLGELVRAAAALPPSALKDSLFNALANGEAALGENVILANIAARARQAAASPEAAITRAFQSESLPQASFAKLGQALTALFPEQKPLIDALVAGKEGFIRLVDDNRQALLHSVTTLAKEGGLTPEALARLAQSLREGGAPELAKALVQEQAKAQTQAQPQTQPSASLKTNEAELILSRLFPQGGPEAETLRAALRLPGRERAPTAESVLERFSLKLDSAGPKDIDLLLNGLKDSAEAARTLLSRAASPETAKVAEHLARVGDTLEFVAQAKTNLFAHLPLAVPGGEANAELYVFRDKKRRESADGSASALIALDTLNLGRFEVYVRKQGKAVDCQFRLRDDDIEALVRARAPELEAALAERSFRLRSCSFRKLGEVFTPLSPEPRMDDGEAPQSRPFGRISFDVRT